MSRILFTLTIALLLVGCYTQKKANQQHGRAVSTYPEIGAEFCARVYPAKDSIIKGDSVVEVRIIEHEGETRIDTVYLEGKPVTIVKTVTLPGKETIRTVTRTDTIQRENTARLDDCNLEKKKLTTALTTEQGRADKYQGQAKKRGMIMWGLIGLIVLAGGTWVYFQTKNKKI